jgi:cytochrome c-type biogenesis protein CcmF
LLWAIWHCVLAQFVMRKNNIWENEVMTVVSLAQIFLSSTLLGLYFFGEKIGSSPFALLRDVMVDAPIFQQPNYLNIVTDGNGLNPLLQNYWMVIHPPILFLGFASTLFPFAYALAGIYKKNYDDWILPTIRWSVFSSMILGTGIMMGGAWAYESLNFGGYWAWDPVENASLVPWLTMIAGLHTLMIYKATGYSLKATLLFFIVSFILILYSTFLTRTGILGDTSVHAFTGEGKSLFYHLIIVMSLFTGISFFFYIKNYKSIPDKNLQEEEATSREFWMFIGSLVLMIAVVQITYSTSMPVWNKMFGTNLTISDPIDHYNKIQVWIASILALMMPFAYYLKFKNTSWAIIAKKIIIVLVITILLTIIIAYTQKINVWQMDVFLFSALFLVVGNAYYIYSSLRSAGIKKWGGSIAHIGFGLMLLGILFSSFNKHVISVNRLGVDLGLEKKTKEETQKENRENLLLFRGVPVRMDEYILTYIGDSISEPNHFYKVMYQKRENDTGKIIEQFILEPLAQINPKMGLISSPGTKHYATKDVFTYITSTLDKDKVKDTSTYTTQKVKLGDSLFFANGFMIFKGFNTNVSNANYEAQQGDVAVSANLTLYNITADSVGMASPIYFIRDKQENILEDTVKHMNLFTRFSKIYPKENAVDISYKQPSSMNEYIIMKAIVFPYINVLWIGTVLMILGFLISLWKRITVKK